jgi:predicted Zn finger-like uncharacterized protein
MRVTVQCPSCESRLKVEEQKRGKKVRCPKCEEVFTAGTKKSRPDDEEPDDEEQGEAQGKERGKERGEEEGEVRVRRKKKKKKKKQPSLRGLRIAGLAGGGVIALALLIWVALKLTAGAPPVQPVTTWEKYGTEEGEFGFEYPADWRAKSYGPSASITVKENLTGSLLGDIAGAANGGGPVDDDQLPVARVHEARRPKDSKSYQEKPAKTVQTRIGKARRSAYADGAKRGYRATVLLNQTALDVFCECKASDWETLRPAFEHVIESLGRGQP